MAEKIKTKKKNTKQFDGSEFSKELLDHVVTLIKDDKTLNEIEIMGTSGWHIRISRGVEAIVKPSVTHSNIDVPNVVANNQATDIQLTEEPSSNESKLSEDDSMVVVSSPMVGVIYKRPKPDAEDFISKGAHVKEGDVLFLIEAMKVFNEVKAPEAGVIEQLFIADGQAVEYGHVLAKIKKD